MLASVVLLVAAVVMLAWLLAPPILIEIHRKTPHLPASPPAPLPEPEPLLSVIVPARDEERRIEGCLRSILEQGHPNFELIVVDDRSSDRTATLVEQLAAADPRLRLVRGRECPPGWAGKNHALAQGVEAARGDHFLMLDADVTLRGDCLREAHSLALRTGAGLTTLMLGVEFHGFWEKVLQPLMFEMMILFIPPDQVNDPELPDKAMAPGPFLLFARDAYEAIGGHAGMKAEIVEDLALAKAIKRERLGLTLASAPELTVLSREVTFGRLWEGWSRVTFKGLDRRLGLALLGVLAIFLTLVGPWLAVPVAIAAALLAPAGTPTLGWWLLAAFGGATVLAQISARQLLDRHYGIPASTVWLQPLAGLFAIAVIVNSALLAGGKSTVVWKGRVYDAQH